MFQGIFNKDHFQFLLYSGLLKAVEAPREILGMQTLPDTAKYTTFVYF